MERGKIIRLNPLFKRKGRMYNPLQRINLNEIFLPFLVFKLPQTNLFSKMNFELWIFKTSYSKEFWKALI